MENINFIEDYTVKSLDRPSANNHVSSSELIDVIIQRKGNLESDKFRLAIQVYIN